MSFWRGHHCTAQYAKRLFCQSVLQSLSPQLEKGPGIDFSRPADVLMSNWSLSHPAAFYLIVIHPLNTDLILEASLASGNSAECGEVGKHAKNDEMCSELGWTCIPLVVEVYGG